MDAATPLMIYNPPILTFITVRLFHRFRVNRGKVRDLVRRLLWCACSGRRWGRSSGGNRNDGRFRVVVSAGEAEWSAGGDADVPGGGAPEGGAVWQVKSPCSSRSSVGVPTRSVMMAKKRESVPRRPGVVSEACGLGGG